MSLELSVRQFVCYSQNLAFPKRLSFLYLWKGQTLLNTVARYNTVSIFWKRKSVKVWSAMICSILYLNVFLMFYWQKNYDKHQPCRFNLILESYALFYHFIITYIVKIMTSLRTSLSVNKSYNEINSSTSFGDFVDLRL